MFISDLLYFTSHLTDPFDAGSVSWLLAYLLGFWGAAATAELIMRPGKMAEIPISCHVRL